MSIHVFSFLLTFHATETGFILEMEKTKQKKRRENKIKKWEGQRL